MATPAAVVRAAVELLNEAAAGGPGGAASQEWPEG